jgi:hypothetical protein
MEVVELSACLGVAAMNTFGKVAHERQRILADLVAVEPLPRGNLDGRDCDNNPRNRCC